MFYYELLRSELMFQISQLLTDYQAKLTALVQRNTILKIVAADKSLRPAFFSFLLSRAIVFAVLILTTHIAQPHQLKQFGQIQRPIVRLSAESVQENLRPLAVRADCFWYIGIAVNGYDQIPFDTYTVHNWAFFPLHPLIWRGATYLTGEYELTGIVLVNILCFFALYLLHKTFLAFGLNQENADRAVLYTALFPLSFHFSIPMTESLFLLLTAGSFCAAKREQWLLAGILGGCASATRFVGILLFPTLIILAIQTYRGQFRSYPKAWGVLLVPVGLASFMLYLHSVTGNAFAFKDIQTVWGRESGIFLKPLYYYLLDPLEVSYAWDFRIVNFLIAVGALLCVLVLLKWREWALAFFTFFSIIIPLSSLSLQAMSRYALVVFPIFMVLAVAGRSPKINIIIQTVFAALLALMTALYAANFSTAMA